MQGHLGAIIAYGMLPCKAGYLAASCETVYELIPSSAVPGSGGRQGMSLVWNPLTSPFSQQERGENQALE